MSSWQCGGVWAPTAVSIFSASTISILSILVTLGNALIILVIYKDPLKTLHTPFTYFVVNLACADLIVGVVTCPIYAYTLVLESLGQLNEVLAITYHLTFFISSTASILSLVALSIDRYTAITFPFRYKSLLTGSRCRWITFAIWTISLAVSWVYIKVGFIEHLFVFANSAIILAFIIFIGTYFRVYSYLRAQTAHLENKMTSLVNSSNEQINRLTMDRHITRVFMTVLVVFLCTYCPATVMIYILQYCPTCHCTIRHWLRDLVTLLITMNSCINPFIYTIRLKAFRTSLSLVVRRRDGRARQTSSSLSMELQPKKTQSHSSNKNENENESEIIVSAQNQIFPVNYFTALKSCV